jgi:hypothetical protein
VCVCQVVERNIPNSFQPDMAFHAKAHEEILSIQLVTNNKYARQLSALVCGGLKVYSIIVSIGNSFYLTLMNKDYSVVVVCFCMSFRKDP